MTTGPGVAIVTGASAGIGRATSESLVRAGWSVALVARESARLEHVQREIEQIVSADGVVRSFAADVSDWQQADRTVDRVMETFGRLDALVNNAAIVFHEELGVCSQEVVDAILRTNIVGPLALANRVFREFRAQGGGCIVNISSFAASSPWPGLSAYAASKSALESLTRSIAIEGARLGIEAYSVAPGAVETGMLRSLHSETELPPERTLTPEAVARVIVDCVAGRRRAQSGKVIELDAG